jgi:hypothetical protein
MLRRADAPRRTIDDDADALLRHAPYEECCIMS